ncbi:phosphate-binding protein [Thiohalobacter sp. COW1]|uniref:Phosphate ABC transporter, periplasmic phosphate-binding protein n=1 Tax=Thiohalobacter thiocyanaticus TaxID=585455 RepID=A0A1Z4VMS3_9GAMM|nr:MULTISPECIES: phosphate ABC transporter substrate-binding protein [Thiohalobacter]BAZ92897.1 phosphate ABC transporter, periplasmic phosphate-binding protein [Thiohalobacter thiocyanaticus]BCO32142.1 phosphate-binding protein [Thiohalobacter sp. COW1]
MIRLLYRPLGQALGLCLFAASALAASGGQSLSLNWVGCGISKKAYMQEIATLYEKKTGIHIDIAGGGATKGIREISANKVDIGGSCRFRLPNNSAESDAVMVPVAWDALVIITHPDNPVGDLTLDQLRLIYTGKLTNWNALGGPDAPINVYVRQGNLSGVGYKLRELVFANPDQTFAATEVFPSSGPLEQAVETDVHAIAVSGISSARKRNVKLMQLEGKDPTYENIRDGEYLLYRPLYLAYNRDGENAEEVKKFIQFVHGHEGQAVLRHNGTVPYLEAIHLVRKKLEQSKRARENAGL